jgi:hypothetical protein
MASKEFVYYGSRFGEFARLKAGERKIIGVLIIRSVEFESVAKVWNRTTDVAAMSERFTFIVTTRELGCGVGSGLGMLGGRLGRRRRRPEWRDDCGR